MDPKLQSKVSRSRSLQSWAERFHFGGLRGTPFRMTLPKPTSIVWAQTSPQVVKTNVNLDLLRYNSDAMIEKVLPACHWVHPWDAGNCARANGGLFWDTFQQALVIYAPLFALAAVVSHYTRRHRHANSNKKLLDDGHGSVQGEERSNNGIDSANAKRGPSASFEEGRSSMVVTPETGGLVQSLSSTKSNAAGVAKNDDNVDAGLESRSSDRSQPMFNFPSHVVWLLRWHKARMDDGSGIYKAAVHTVRSSTFLATLTGGCAFILCTFTRGLAYFDLPDYPATALAGGFLGGWLSVSVERKSRRAELALFCMNQALEVVYRLFVKRSWTRMLPHGQVIVFALALAVLGYFNQCEPAALKPTVRRTLQLVLGGEC